MPEKQISKLIDKCVEKNEVIGELLDALKACETFIGDLNVHANPQAYAIYKNTRATIANANAKKLAWNN